MDSKLTNIPTWARSRLQDLTALAQGKSENVEGLPKRKIPSQDVSSHVARNREILSEIHLDDENPERDQALGEKGVVRRDGVDINCSGNALNGEFAFVRENSFAYVRFNGTETTRVDINKDGPAAVSKTDLAKPEEAVIWGAPSPGSGVSVPESEFADTTTSAATLLKDQPKDSLFRQVFLDGSKSMPEARGQLMGQLKNLTSRLSPEQSKQFAELLEKPDANTARRLVIEATKQRRQEPQNKALKDFVETAGTWQALEDFPKLMADGVMRNSINYMTPLHLATQTAAQGWDFDKTTGLPIADSVVVGGGPGGLSTAYHLSENGHRTVVLEGGSTGQAFSDGNAASVHQLRTTVEQTNLTYTPNANHLGIDVSLTRQRYNIPNKVGAARDEWYQATGQEIHGFAASDTGLVRPANRNELYEHMSMMSRGLATRYPDTFVIENSPVTDIEVTRGEDGERLYKVTTEQGHQMMSRSLVLATGFVGTAGQHARTLKQFSELDKGEGSGVAVLGSDHDLVSKNDRLDKDSLVFSERLLGRPEIRQRVKGLPKGSRLAVVGGGESAAKGALEALHLNPNLKVDLYTSQPLEPYQTQIPSSALSGTVTETAIVHPEIAKETMESLKEFKTPIVSSTLRELLELETAGRVRIREMGKRFDQSTVEVKPKESGGFALQVTDPEVKENLKEQRDSWLSVGLYGTEQPAEAADEFPDADMVMMAVGYDRRSCQAGPLVQQLVDQGVIEFENGEVSMGPDGLTSADDPMIAINTAAVQKMAADSALPGRAVRAYRLGHYFQDKLPQREKPSEAIEKGLKFNDYIDTNQTEDFFQPDLEEARGYLESGGLPKNFVEHNENRLARLSDPIDKKLATYQWEAQKAYPNSAEPLRDLRQRELEVPESLDPIEQLIARRAKQLRDRL